MLPLDRIELPYPDDSAVLFDRIVHMPSAVFLDSCHPHYASARYDILAADPYCTLTTRGATTRVRSRDGEYESGDDPFALLHAELGKRAPVEASDLPFCGGAIGYFGYDLGRRIEALPCDAVDDLALPEMAVGLYDWAIVIDHHECRAWLVGCNHARVRPLLKQPALRTLTGFAVKSALYTNMDRENYANAFHRIKRYIRDGDCYQVNLARRFSARVDGDPWPLYRQLRLRNPAPFAAFMKNPACSVLSISPERFLKLVGRNVETCPIKGTRPRATDSRRDHALAAALQNSAKDRAENLMIVDLLRNDLGKACATGTVRVPELFAIEHFPTVHHLVSTVTGRLANELGATDLLRACFPGGSITGAPKVRAMQIIDELEPNRRGVYCGAIGYLGFDGSMDTNIAIRTMVWRNDTVHFWAGGGIVADSELEAEYQEIMDKAQAMLTLMQESETATCG